MICWHGEYSLQVLQTAVQMQMEEMPKGRRGNNRGRKPIQNFAWSKNNRIMGLGQRAGSQVFRSPEKDGYGGCEDWSMPMEGIKARDLGWN